MPDKDSLMTLLQDWLALSKSGALNDLFAILDAHRVHCNAEALAAIRRNDNFNAIRWEAKSEDCWKIEEAIRKRIDDLKKGVE